MNKKNLLTIITEISTDQKQLQAFLKVMLTEAEWKEMQNRWKILCMLEEGISQRIIAERIGTGIATITRGSREWKSMDPALKKFLKK